MPSMAAALVTALTKAPPPGEVGSVLRLDPVISTSCGCWLSDFAARELDPGQRGAAPARPRRADGEVAARVAARDRDGECAGWGSRRVTCHRCVRAHADDDGHTLMALEALSPHRPGMDPEAGMGGSQQGERNGSDGKASHASAT